MSEYEQGSYEEAFSKGFKEGGVAELEKWLNRLIELGEAEYENQVAVAFNTEDYRKIKAEMQKRLTELKEKRRKNE